MNFKESLISKFNHYLTPFEDIKEGDLVKLTYKRVAPALFQKEFFTLVKQGAIPVLFDELNPDSNQLFSEVQRSDDPDLKHQDLAFISFTSGSSGKPKAILYTWESIYKSAIQTNDFYQISKDDHWACVLPLSHIGGIMILFRCLLSGAKISFHSPSSFNETLDESTTLISLVPAQLSKITTLRKKLKSLRCIILGGSLSNKNHIKEAIVAGFNLSNSYGQSETCAQLSATPITNNLETLLSIGLPFKENNFHIDESGTLKIESSRLALKYLNGPRFNGVLQTQDIIEFANDSFYIKGRADDIYISGGENISKQRVINALEDSLSGLKALCLHPHDKFGTISYAIVSEQKDLQSNAQLRTRLSTLSNFEKPHLFFFDFDHSEGQLKITEKIKEQYAKALNRFQFLKDLKINSLHFGKIDGPPLYVFHGFMGDLNDFKFLSDSKLVKRYHIVLVDLPGHGKTTSTNKNICEFSKLFAKKIDQQGATLLGYSLGGRFSYEVSKNLKNKTKIILESSSLGLSKEERAIRLEKDRSLFANVKYQDDLMSFLDRWYAMPLFQKMNKQIIERIKERRSFAQIEDWQQSLERFSVGHQEFVIPEILPHDYFYICGSLDQKYKEYAKYFKNSLIIDESSHNTHVMNEELFIEYVESSLL